MQVTTAYSPTLYLAYIDCVHTGPVCPVFESVRGAAVDILTDSDAVEGQFLRARLPPSTLVKLERSQHVCSRWPV